jgi:putative transposase
MRPGSDRRIKRTQADEALLQLFYLVLRNFSKKRTMPIRDWKAALNRLTIQFGRRLPQR